ncbi:MAG: hypothetical protein CL758_01495 [Chloroflexi bacterium]|nr:hypothetical protein [Chloroflexota bacterium]
MKLIDILPPYVVTEGLLDAKEITSDGYYYINVGSIKVKIDASCYESLIIGENLRVRHTKRGQIINIDRIIPKKGPV